MPANFVWIFFRKHRFCDNIIIILLLPDLIDDWYLTCNRRRRDPFKKNEITVRLLCAKWLMPSLNIIMIISIYFTIFFFFAF